MKNLILFASILVSNLFVLLMHVVRIQTQSRGAAAKSALLVAGGVTPGIYLPPRVALIQKQTREATMEPSANKAMLAALFRIMCLFSIYERVGVNRWFNCSMVNSSLKMGTTRFEVFKLLNSSTNTNTNTNTTFNTRTGAGGTLLSQILVSIIVVCLRYMISLAMAKLSSNEQKVVLNRANLTRTCVVRYLLINKQLTMTNTSLFPYQPTKVNKPSTFNTRTGAIFTGANQAFNTRTGAILTGANQAFKTWTGAAAKLTLFMFYFNKINNQMNVLITQQESPLVQEQEKAFSVGIIKLKNTNTNKMNNPNFGYRTLIFSSILNGLRLLLGGNSLKAEYRKCTIKY